MPSLADEFRAEARANPGTVAKRKIGGWSFCLSYGAVDPQELVQALDAGMRVHVDGLGDKTEEVAEKLRAVTSEDYAVAQEIMAGEWMLSVKPFPPTRQPTDKDRVETGPRVSEPSITLRRTASSNAACPGDCLAIAVPFSRVVSESAHHFALMFVVSPDTRGLGHTPLARHSVNSAVLDGRLP